MPKYHLTKNGFSLIVGNIAGKYITWVPLPEGRDYLRKVLGELKQGVSLSMEHVKVMKASGYLSGPDPWKDQPEFEYSMHEDPEILDLEELQKLWFGHIESHPELNFNGDFRRVDNDKDPFKHIVTQSELAFDDSSLDSPMFETVEERSRSFFGRLRSWFLGLFKQ